MYSPALLLLPIAALTAAVAAAPNALGTRDSQCSTGALQCCQSTQTATSTALSSLGGLLGIVLPTVEGLIGLGCTPITVIGVGSGASCTSQAVCCTDNSFNGLVNLGCTPINLSL